MGEMLNVSHDGIWIGSIARAIVVISGFFPVVGVTAMCIEIRRYARSVSFSSYRQ